MLTIPRVPRDTEPKLRVLLACLCGAALAVAIAFGPRAFAAPAATVLFVNDTVPDGLVAHWKFDEVGATSARDFAGTKAANLKNGASMQASPLPTVTFPNSGALVLDGVDDRAEISNTAALNLAANFSVLGWLRRASTGNYDAIYDSGDQANHWWVFIANSFRGEKFGFGVRGITETYSTQAITDNNWHHFAVTKNGNGADNLAFYVDGQQRGTGSVGALNTPTGNKYIGVLTDTVFAAPFGGSLDDIRLYNRALSAAEVLRLAQGHGCVFDGSSWPAAMRELQCALSEASSGDEIWLANGIYRAGVNREMSFVLRDGVNVLGGFTANLSNPSQRAPFFPFGPPTLLLGDLNGDDVPGSFATYGDNTRQVLVAPPGATVLLDRFGVQGGNADGRFTQTVGYGGGLFVSLGANVRLNQMAFLRNQTATRGGGVFSQSPIAISATTFISNNSNAFGGGLGVTATLQLTNSDFFSNTTAAFGGGLYAEAPAQIVGGIFIANRAAGGGEGGGLYTNGALTVFNATFARNFAGFAGGGVYGSLAPIVVVSSTFTANTIGTFDGAGLETTGPLWISHSTFMSHTTPFGGSAVYVSGPATIHDSTFLNNKATGANCIPACNDGRGGAIKAFNALTVSNSTFFSNTARLTGGAIAANGPLLVTRSELDGNVAGNANDTLNPGRGGAIFASKGLTLSFSTVATNSATVVGGGLFVSGTVLVLNTNILSNTAQNGGGMRLDGGTAQVAGSLFAGNVVTGSGAALSVVGSDALLVNDTFAGRAANAHEAVSATGSNLLVNNTLFANYTGSVLIDMSSLLTYSNNLFFNTPLPNAGTDGGHNLSADPQFVDGAGGNYRLTQTSPAVDAGLDAAVPPFLAVDLDGGRRVADLPGVGVVVNGVVQQVDIGAYEYQPPAIFLPVIIR